MKRIIGTLLGIIITFGISTAVFAETSTDKKEIGVTATVDVGPNTKELLEKGGETVVKMIEELSKSLGMTGEKIFPYYVKQVYVSGVAKLITYTAFEVVCLLLAFAIYLYAVNHKKETGFAIAIFIIFVLGLILGVFFIPDWVTMVQNPEYHAIQEIMTDAGKIWTATKH